MPPTYDIDKDDPSYAIQILSQILIHVSPHLSETRLLKARYLLKTLALAGPLDEAEVDRAWVHAFCPDEEEPPAEALAKP
jgi:hypothetical protein